MKAVAAFEGPLGPAKIDMAGVDGTSMAKKLFFDHEMNAAWRIAREKGIEYARARGHSPNSLHNDQKGMLYAACEMQDMGCSDPADIDQIIFNRWREYTMSDDNRSEKAITEKGFKKRKEALILLLKANKLDDPLEIVQMHKSNIVQDDIKFWSGEELDAMTERALEVFENEPKKQATAIAHILHVVCAPRREDTASMKWAWIDLDDVRILFPAKKNGNQPGNVIQNRFIPILSRWMKTTTEFDGGDEFVFPASMAQASGTTRVKRLHVTGKTISDHLEYIRSTTIMPDGSQPQKLSSHKYRHTFAMLALKRNCKPFFIGKVLGDTLATVEKFYSRFLLNDAHKAEHAKMMRGQNERIPAAGTAQPSWLKRHPTAGATARQLDIAEGFRLYRDNRVAVNGSGGSSGSEGYGRWGI